MEAGVTPPPVKQLREVFRGSATHCNLGVGCDEAGKCYAEEHGAPERCGINLIGMPPPEPAPGESVVYRGWKAALDYDAQFWTQMGWRAYRGGVDLDAPEVSANTWIALLDEIDAVEDE